MSQPCPCVRQPFLAASQGMEAEAIVQRGPESLGTVARGSRPWRFTSPPEAPKPTPWHQRGGESAPAAGQTPHHHRNRARFRLAASATLEAEGFHSHVSPRRCRRARRPRKRAGAVTDETILISVMPVNNEMGSDPAHRGDRPGCPPARRGYAGARRRGAGVSQSAARPRGWGSTCSPSAGTSSTPPKASARSTAPRGATQTVLWERDAGRGPALRNRKRPRHRRLGRGDRLGCTRRPEASAASLTSSRARLMEGLPPIDDACVNGPVGQGAGPYCEHLLSRACGAKSFPRAGRPGVYVSTGSACSSRSETKVTCSAMGVSRERLESRFGSVFRLRRPRRRFAAPMQAFGPPSSGVAPGGALAGEGSAGATLPAIGARGESPWRTSCWSVTVRSD